jgi:hypothetical protein
MTGTGAVFSLRYELRPDDLRELLDAYTSRRRRRITNWFALVGWALVSSALVAITVAIAVPARTNGSAGPPTWLYVIDVAALSLAFQSGRRVWLLSPGRSARRAFHAHSEMHGVHADEVGADGVTSIAPDGRRTFVPWSAVAGIRETEHAFHLTGAEGETVGTLPKRGLESPDLLPDLRAFLHDSVGKDPAPAPPAAEPSTPDPPAAGPPADPPAAPPAADPPAADPPAS